MNAKHKSSLLKRDNLKRSCGHRSGLRRFDNQHFWEWCWLGEHKEQPKENHCQQGWTSDGNHDALSLWMDCIDSCDPTPLRNPQVLHEMGETHSCPEAVCLGRLGTMSMYKYLFSKSQQLSLGRGSTIRWPSHLGKEILLWNKAATTVCRLLTRAALGVQMVTLGVYGFGGGWMNRLGYLLNLVLACNVLLHERLSGSGQIEHTGSNTAGPQGKAFTWYLLKILSLNGDYIRWPPVNLSFEVSSTTFSLIHLIQHEKTPSVTNAKSWMWERLKDIAADSENVQH